MKKIIAASVTSLALAAMPIFGAFAETVGTGTQTHDVTVGEVEGPSYSVDISWGDLTFDWKYDEYIKKYTFKPQMSCTENIKLSEFSPDEEYYENQSEFFAYASYVDHLYSDSECTTPVYIYDTGLDENTVYYTKTEPENRIQVLDYSTNARVNATISFAADSEYDWLDGMFSDLVRVNEFEEVGYYSYNNESDEYVVLNPEDIHENSHFQYQARGGAGNIRIHGYFFLKKKQDATFDASSITAGDKIGTITINIEPDLD